MRQIADYKEYSPLIMKYFKRGVITNNFLSPESCKCEIEEGRLYCIEGKDFLNLYVKRSGFFQLYFYAMGTDILFPEVSEKLVCEFKGDFGELMNINGFCRYLSRVKLERDAETEEAVKSENKAEEKDAGAVYELMQKSFDKYSACLPTFSEIRKECRNGFIYVMKQEGKIAGVLRAGLNGKTAKIMHLCIDESFRGKGLGKQLCREFLAENRGRKCAVWTGKENEPAKKLYLSLGFLQDDTEAEVYMKG